MSSTLTYLFPPDCLGHIVNAAGMVEGVGISQVTNIKCQSLIRGTTFGQVRDEESACAHGCYTFPCDAHDDVHLSRR